MTLVAAAFMMIGGLFDFFEGLAALIRGQFFVVLPNYAFSISVTGWGWLHLIMGIVVFATGAALLTDHLWARIAGVVIASAQRGDELRDDAVLAAVGVHRDRARHLHRLGAAVTAPALTRRDGPGERTFAGPAPAR